MLGKLVVALFAATAVSASQQWHVNSTDGSTCIIVKADPTLTVNFKDVILTHYMATSHLGQ